MGFNSGFKGLNLVVIHWESLKLSDTSVPSGTMDIYAKECATDDGSCGGSDYFKRAQ